MTKTINLSELKNNPELANALMLATQPKEKKKTVKKLKVKKPQSIAILPTDETAPKETKVKHDDDTALKHEIVEQHIKKAEGYFEQNPPIYTSMEIMFSSAYRFADMKNRVLLAQARRLCKSALKLEQNKIKTKAKLKARGLRLSKLDAKQFSTSEIKEELKEIFTNLFENLAFETKKQQGTSYNDAHKAYAVDLSKYDDASKVIVLSRANLIISVGNHVDLEDIKRSSKHIEVAQVEGPIFVIKNALIVGFAPHALPRKITEETLEISMASTFQVKATPVPTQLRHPTSNRIWFYVPEYRKILIKSLSFADRSLNSEFEAFKSISNNPSEEDIRFLFIRAGVEYHQIEAIVRRWKACDSYQGRIAILTNEYNTLKLRQKTQRLRNLRQDFVSENKDLYDTINKDQDRLHFLEEVSSDVRVEFSTLASHTGNPEHGLSIANRKRLTEAFHQFESVAVRGITDSHERIQIRKGIRRDRIQCRKLIHDWQASYKEAKQVRSSLKDAAIRIEMLKKRSFKEYSGKEEIEDELD